jgi:hypothetical protein
MIPVETRLGETEGDFSAPGIMLPGNLNSPAGAT